MNNDITDSLSLSNVEDILDLKKCDKKLSSKCLGLAQRKNFRGNFCINCANVHQLNQKNEQAYKQKFTALQKLGLDNESIEQLCNLLHPHQIDEFIKIIEKSNILTKTTPKLTIL
jgi:Holliday junction resolvasome RuvABC DNA-binding subunit